MKKYHYLDVANGAAVISEIPLTDSGLVFSGMVEDFSVADDLDTVRAKALSDLPKLIGKRQAEVMTDDREQMWRYAFAVQAARFVLAMRESDTEALPDVKEAFGELFAAWKVANSALFGAMDSHQFALYLLGMYNQWLANGLRLEASLMMARHELELADSVERVNAVMAVIGK